MLTRFPMRMEFTSPRITVLNHTLHCAPAKFIKMVEPEKAQEMNRKIAHNYLMYSKWYKIVDTGLLKSVKLAVQTLPVAAFSFRAEYRSRPEVSAGETVDGISAVKLSEPRYATMP